MNNFHCLRVSAHNDNPHYDYCRSPTACAGFGYCRERNFDGAPMDGSQIAKRRAESAAPELLAALRSLVTFITDCVPEPHNPRILAAISALRKAEGP